MSTYKSIIWLAILIIVLVFIAYFFGVFGSSTASPVVTSTPLRTPPPTPALVESRTVKAIGTKGFSLLVSYTDQGFEPKTASIHTGDVVRFVNNSTKPMWITNSNYPAKNKKCGTSALDTCKELSPGEYWEFTFSAPGVWTFADKFSDTAKGSVTVQ
ncbi:cupredoxin domain-containing protein [Candidatus Kaiserbacteria bacterium]|nr:cupredoxin domain-containing protein [Candidatus Kaiserbacteria bacterium]